MITSLQNNTIKQMRRLQGLAGRRDQKRFLVEGTHLVEEAIQSKWPLESIFFTPDWESKNERLASQLRRHPNYIAVSDQVLRSVATTENPDGVIGIGTEQPETTLAMETIHLGIAAERLQNPDNLGALIRSAVAADAQGVWLGEGSVDGSNPKVLRASVGQWFRSPPRSLPLAPWLAKCRENSIQLLGTAPHGTCFWEVDLTRPTIFVLGNEGSGLSDAIRASLDAMVSIPMAPQVESLNVAVAGALLLYEAKRQRSLKQPRT